MINTHTLTALLTCVAGKDEPRAWLRDVLYCSATHCLVTTDGHRMIWLKLPDNVPHMSEDFTIPASAVREAIAVIGKRPLAMNVPRMLTRGALGPVTFEPGDGWPTGHNWRRVVPAGGAAALRGVPANVQPRYAAALHACGSVTWYAVDDDSVVPFRLHAGPQGEIMHGVVMPLQLGLVCLSTWEGAPPERAA